MEGHPGQETVWVFQSQPGVRALPGIDFSLTAAGGQALRVIDGAITERSLAGSYALLSEGDYAVGMVHQPSADFTLHFSGTAEGTFDLDLILPQGGRSSILLTYADLAVTAASSGTLRISSDQVDAPLALDRDGDGMPDEWEARHGLDPADASDSSADRDGDGYTNIEEWLNGSAR